MNNKANLFVIAAPSGAGKTSLVNALLTRLNNLKISVSYTTRPPRPQDQEGVDYHFIDDAQFQQMINNRDFLEYANVYGYHYGTSKDWVTSQLEAGVDVILEIDWQGARQIRSLYPPAKLVFILPPALEALHERLKKRRQDSPETIARRLKEARQDMSHCHEFDYIVVNDDFDQALKDLEHILAAERLQYDVQRVVHAELLVQLLKKE